jgi:hypothetical protein
MFVDPVVEEVRRNGAEFAEECGGDIHRMAEELRREEAEHPERIVDRAAMLRDKLRGVPPLSA